MNGECGMWNGKYAIRSNTGQLLLTQQISHAGTAANYKIETGKNIANGRYLLEFIKPDRSKLTKALVIAAGK